MKTKELIESNKSSNEIVNSITESVFDYVTLTPGDKVKTKDGSVYTLDTHYAPGDEWMGVGDHSRNKISSKDVIAVNKSKWNKGWLPVGYDWRDQLMYENLSENIADLNVGNIIKLDWDGPSAAKIMKIDNQGYHLNRVWMHGAKEGELHKGPESFAVVPERELKDMLVDSVSEASLDRQIMNTYLDYRDDQGMTHQQALKATEQELNIADTDIMDSLRTSGVQGISEGMGTIRKIVKRAKSLGINTWDELENLIRDEFPNATGADFTFARQELGI